MAIYSVDLILFFVFCFIIFCLPLILIFLSYLVAPSYSYCEKVSMYECGFEPFQNARIKFEVHFYIVAILFLIFDIEVVYLLIWVLVIEKVDTIGYFMVILFLTFLTLGFLFEWKLGVLNWY